MDVTITRGVDWQDNLRSVPADQWGDLIGKYRLFCQRALPHDCRALLRMIDEGSHVAWAGYSDRDSFLRDGLGLDPLAVGWAVEGLQILGVEEAISFQEAQDTGKERWSREQAVDVPTGNELGTNQHSEGVINKNITPYRGTSASYRLSRLKRDHPEIAARYVAGEFRSVAHACRAADGISDNVEGLKKIWLRSTPDERNAFYTWAEDGADG